MTVYDVTVYDWKSVQRLLVVRLDNIGDVIMLGPSLRCLKQSLPQAQVTLLGSPAGAQAAPLLPWIDDVVVHRALWQELDAPIGADPGSQLALVEELAARRFDVALIFSSFSQSPYPPAYACYLAGIAVRVGQSKEFGGGVLTHWIKAQSDDMHQVDRNLLLLESLGFQPDDRRLSLRIGESEQDEADRLLQAVGVEPMTPFIVLAAGASCSARRYDLHRAAIVARALPRYTGLAVVLVGSPRERELLEPLMASDASQVRSLVGRTSVPGLAAVMNRAALVITNNSGPMHIADALEKPTVVLFSGTELESQWRPRRAAVSLLNRPVFCSPCHNFDCPYALECLDVPPRQVLDEVMRLLDCQQQPNYVMRVSRQPIAIRGNSHE